MRLGASAHGGISVRITSTNPSLLLVSPNATTVGAAFIDVSVANGSTDATYFVQGVADARGTATLTVTAPGFTSTQGNVNVVAPALQIESLASSISATATSDIFQVRVGIADSFNNTLTQSQAVAAGSSLVATVTNSAAGVAQLVTAAGGAQSRTVTIACRVVGSLRRRWRVEASNSIRSLPESRPSSRPSRESSRLPPGR